MIMMGMGFVFVLAWRSEACTATFRPCSVTPGKNRESRFSLPSVCYQVAGMSSAGRRQVVK